MITTFRSLLTVVMSLVVVVTGYGSTPPLGGVIVESLGERTKARLDSLAHENLEFFEMPGMAIAVINNGQLAYAKGFGVLDIETQEPVEATTTFGAGSVSQMFVATAIMQLVERGEVDLDAPVVRYLPYFELADERYASITIRHLLGYTSGMPALHGPGLGSPEYDDGALERFVRSLGSTRLIAEPGRYPYADSLSPEARGAVAYDVLGDVIAKVSGQSFEDYMQANILDPLGMRGSTFLREEVPGTRAATPHNLDHGTPIASAYPYNRAHAPSLGLQTSVTDLANFATALLNGGKYGSTSILRPASIEILREPGASVGWYVDTSHAGLGCYVGEYKRSEIIWQFHDSAGFQSAIAVVPEWSLAVVLLANAGGAGEGSLPHDLAIQILDELVLMRPIRGLDMMVLDSHDRPLEWQVADLRSAKSVVMA